MAASVTLPSIQDPHGGNYSGQPPPSRGYPPDPRYASPNGGNGYPPPGQAGHPPGYLPPLQPGSDHRSPAYPPEHRSSYYDDRRHPQYSDYPPDYYYRQGGPPPNGYPRDYRGPPPGSYPPDFGQGVGAPMAQAAPRQRTSIACRYCRKRKIRCSGYQSAPGGKCQNCARMNQECIFQPVSSSSSTAFVPLSAVQGGVPPGTQLFGAYGQPLAPNSVPGGHHYPPHHGGPPAPGGAYYGQPGNSPTEPYAPYGGDPREDPSIAVGKRSRDAMDRDEDWRRQAPRSAHEDDPRRRSPAEFSSTSSPGGGKYPYPVPRHSPHAASASTAGAQSRSPGGQNGSSGASTPVRQPGVPATQAQQAPTSKMSLSNLTEIQVWQQTLVFYNCTSFLNYTYEDGNASRHISCAWHSSVTRRLLGRSPRTGARHCIADRRFGYLTLSKVSATLLQSLSASHIVTFLTLTATTTPVSCAAIIHPLLHRRKLH
ncbi:hypothetical protein LMH87_001913 [Akanthomyces muscarius]|uniref:Zn(2)-C6 fungal-type domain-containing protein n=1 Tax=Akanthomyces muscarius TaxID=2231603 RepID=A0A9W8Q5A3_AKAMU|nr:hypothetical protein LMH87_001913 [Akanthomyces muscarius]KAJ4147392.1 hypothetical protein LMH87_001913 [Akanthomyces muscarius]